MCIAFLGIFTRPDNELTATASVGPSAAPKAKQAAIGTLGNRKDKVTPTPTSVKITPPKAKNKIVSKFLSIEEISAFSPSLNSNGAMIMTRNNSGSKLMDCPHLVKPKTIPRNICISGAGIIGKMRLAILDSVIVTANTITNSANSMVHPLYFLF